MPSPVYTINRVIFVSLAEKNCFSMAC